LSSAGDTWIGQEVASGRYTILSRIGHGSMGQVYLARDRRLDTDVVVKFPFAGEKVQSAPEFLDRFSREIRSLIQLSHPHIVTVFDAGDVDGHPFVVMQFLAGGSLKDRLACGAKGELRPMKPRSIHDWLLEIAKALDFIHSQKHIHRDVKPANILFDRHGNAFLGDFGIIKALTSDQADSRENSLTAPGFLVGTPNYVAPEIVMGRPFDGRADQYSLAMTVHEVLSGINCMEGPTPSATVVNQTMVVPPALTELIAGIPSRMSDAILRALAKDPSDRFESCVAMAQEILAATPSEMTAGSSSSSTSLTSRGQPGRVPCPACQNPMPVGREHAGGKVRCMRCQATSQVTLLSSNTVQLKLVDSLGSGSSTAIPSPIVVEAPDEFEPDPSAATVLAGQVATAQPAGPPSKVVERRNRFAIAAALLGTALLALVLVAIGRGRWIGPPPVREGSSDTDRAPVTAGATGKPATVVPPADSEAVVINVAYGTEKQKWLEAAAIEFHKTEAGKAITINLHGMGSMEGARAVLDGAKSIPMHVWSPASSAFREAFERQWLAKHENQPILKSENLALTPMVFVMWESRHEPFVKKFAGLKFKTIAEAMQQEGGWGSIAGQPDWGRFKFGHTHPDRSNSGLLTLVLMAYEHSAKDRNLLQSDVALPAFQQWLLAFEQGVTRPGGPLTSSTGTLMREMVLRGPSQYDCVLIYENLAIDYLQAARDRWGDLHVDYPDPNMWNEHPYYILDAPWSDARQRAAAAAFLAFLTSEPIQKRALEHGFRPGNPSVSVRFPDSPLLRYAKQGLKIDLPRMCEPPKDRVLQELLASFRRIEERSLHDSQPE
jgi:serine/threonine-protein kinase